MDNLAEFFGTASDGVTPAVRVLEYDQLTIEKYPRYVLHFKAVDAMEANIPYLFKADEILADKYLPLAMGPTAETTGNESDLITLSFNDGASTRPDARTPRRAEQTARHFPHQRHAHGRRSDRESAQGHLYREW